MALNIETATAYFAGTQDGPPLGWGQHAVAQRTDEHHRLGTPPRCRTSCSRRRSGRRASGTPRHYSNAKFDKALSFVPGGDRAQRTSRSTEKQMQDILLHDTPVIVPYFYNFLAGGQQEGHRLQGRCTGQVFLSHTSLA